jgi:DUF971 family protein
MGRKHRLRARRMQPVLLGSALRTGHLIGSLMAEPVPVDASLLGEHALRLVWSDGREDVLPLDLLRARCPCAECVDEWTGEVRVRRGDFGGITLRSLSEVGSYALRIAFSDGHDLGLYTFRRLRVLGEELHGTQDPGSPRPSLDSEGRPG